MSDYDSIVIGGGISGIISALLRSHFKKEKVLIIEKNSDIGGFFGFPIPINKHNYCIGLHYIGKHKENSIAKILLDFFSDNEIVFENIPSPIESFHFPDFSYRADPDSPSFIESLIKSFPEEKESLLQYKDDIELAYIYLVSGFLYDSKTSLKRNSHFLFQTLNSYMEKKFKDSKLRSILSSNFGNYGAPPDISNFMSHALIMNKYNEGAVRPKGGSSLLKQQLKQALVKYKVDILTNSRVKKLLINEDNQIEGVEVLQAKIKAPLVISSLGVATTYCHLLPQFMNSRDEIINHSDFAKSPLPFILCLKFSQNPEVIGTKWIFSQGDFSQLSQNSKILEARPSYATLSFDENQGEVFSGTLTHFCTYDQIKSQQEFDKEFISQGLLQLLEQYFPKLLPLIESYDLITPHSIEEHMGHINGLSYGLNLSEAWGENHLRSPTTPIGNLYLTGQDIFFPGFDASIISAVKTFSKIEEDPSLINKITSSIQKQ